MSDTKEVLTTKYVIAVVPLGGGRRRLKRWRPEDYISCYLKHDPDCRELDGQPTPQGVWQNCEHWWEATVLNSREEAHTLLGKFLDGLCIPCFGQDYDAEVVPIPPHEQSTPELVTTQPEKRKRKKKKKMVPTLSEIENPREGWTWEEEKGTWLYGSEDKGAGIYHNPKLPPKTPWDTTVVIKDKVWDLGGFDTLDTAMKVAEGFIDKQTEEK